MQIRAILRFRNEDLTRKRLIAGFKTQKKLADFLGIQSTIISEWETFKNYPKKEDLIRNIEVALNCNIGEIFPPEFIKAIERKLGTPLEKVIDIKQLPGYIKGELLLPGPEEAYELKERTEWLEKNLKLLTEREAKILRMRYGIGNFGAAGESTYEEIGDQFRLTKSRIQQIESRALDKLKFFGDRK